MQNENLDKCGTRFPACLFTRSLKYTRNVKLGKEFHSFSILFYVKWTKVASTHIKLNIFLEIRQYKLYIDVDFDI